MRAELAAAPCRSQRAMASAAPPVKHANVYGIDMPTSEELVAHNRTDEEIAEIIKADWLVYQDLESLIECSQIGNPSITQFECSVFDGKYVTGDIDDVYISKLSCERNDAAKQVTDSSLTSEATLVNVHNENE